MACAEPDLNEVARIASSDVAMAAVLIRAPMAPCMQQASLFKHWVRP